MRRPNSEANIENPLKKATGAEAGILGRVAEIRHIFVFGGLLFLVGCTTTSQTKPDGPSSPDHPVIDLSKKSDNAVPPNPATNVVVKKGDAEPKPSSAPNAEDLQMWLQARKQDLALARIADSAPILVAVKAGDLSKVELLLKGDPHLVFIKDSEGMTPLHWAASLGLKTVAELLLSKQR